MALSRLRVTDFRCLQSVQLDLDPKFTLVSGANASGKTSLLEAIYVLGRGRSFRTRRLEHLIRAATSQFVVFGEVHSSDRLIPLGVEGAEAGIRARVAGAKPASLAELALLLPVQVIDPEVHHLIEEGPSRRRRFLDWGVFHVEHAFIGHWQRYQQALKQRNAALKTRQARALVTAWDSDLLHYGDLVSAARARYVDLLMGQAASIARNLLSMDLALTYRRGWPKEQNFAEALNQSWSHDHDSAMTQVGPHRAELGIKLNGLPVKDRISRGQQKLLAAALLLAQMKLFPSDAPVRPSLLLDDPAAELDDDRLNGLIQEVSGHTVQLIVTTLHGEFSAFGAPARRYRIAAGMLSSA